MAGTTTDRDDWPLLILLGLPDLACGLSQFALFRRSAFAILSSASAISS
jgi:hypothetical protein